VCRETLGSNRENPLYPLSVLGIVSDPEQAMAEQVEVRDDLDYRE